MTRINVGLDPKELCDQHLLGEFKEIQRLPNLAKAAFARGEKSFPANPTLGTGHVRFFYPRGQYICSRAFFLQKEMLRRYKKASDVSWMFAEWPTPWAEGDVSAAQLAAGRAILIPRIVERLQTLKRTPTWTRCVAPEWAKIKPEAKQIIPSSGSQTLCL